MANCNKFDPVFKKEFSYEWEKVCGNLRKYDLSNIPIVPIIGSYMERNKKRGK